MKQEDPNKVKDFYDQFSVKQVKTGANIRHWFILNELKKLGLNSTSAVLEIGCGVGTLTKLVSKIASKGSIVATDISPESIAIAKKDNNPYGNIEYVVSDMTNFSHALKFDFVILADVLEHIPVEQHPNLFKEISNQVHERSLIAINIPHPDSLDWVRSNRPELLQIIDQSLRADILLQNMYVNNLRLVSFNSYALFYEKPDYQFLILKPQSAYREHPFKSKLDLLIQRIKYHILT